MWKFIVASFAHGAVSCGHQMEETKYSVARSRLHDVDNQNTFFSGFLSGLFLIDPECTSHEGRGGGYRGKYTKI